MPSPLAPHGGSLRRRLLALVLLPLTAGVAASGGLVADRHADVEAAARAEAALRSVDALSAARTAVVREVLPAFTQLIVEDPELARASGVDAGAATRLSVVTGLQLGATRRGTDAALAAVPQGTRAGAVVREVAAELRRLRDAEDPDLVALYDDYDALVHRLAREERTEVAVALSNGLDPLMLRAISDLQVVSTTTQAANTELPLFLSTRVPLGTGLEANRSRWLTYWGAYRSARLQTDGLGTPLVRAAWERAAADPALRAFDAFSERAAGAGTGADVLSVPEVLRLQLQSGARDSALAAVQRTATDQAVRLAAQRRADAHAALLATVALCALTALLALLLVVLVGRGLTRSLGRLAQDARDVSEGRLVDVGESGPREVRTAARALGTTVAALRQVEEQARRVARGDLGDVATSRPLPGPLGAAVHASLLGIVHAIRQREELQSTLAHQAAHDQLTSLPNRAQALRLIEGALHRGRRAGTAVGLLFVDLDHFKRVNDSLGHAAGDQVLQEVSHRMEQVVRSGDVVCRLGGDEFVVLLERVDDDPRALLDLAHRTIAAVSAPVRTHGRDVTVGASVGIAVARDGDGSASRLLAEADAAAYRAKAGGRGGAELFDDALRSELQHRTELEDAIRSGLRAGEFLLHYQPVVDVPSGAVRGFEALMRWERRGHGLVAPDAFIPVAEKSSLVADLGRFALAEATRQLVAWTGGGLVGDDVTVAVNVSGHHLAGGHVVEDVQDALAASGLDPRRLVLEITETTVVDDPVAVERLAALRRLGVSVAIDDFGTGYTSIGQLQRLPVDTLKIDRSFVASTEPRYRELVHLIVSAAHTFGLRVVAEGVEESHQLSALREVGCDEAQGFLIARPMPPAAVLAQGPARAGAS
ncbi:putative bifunctional diguanylate cyclase/phosphodiesterase [Vallicoccus soli]|uniref:Bifunctional diguanylate cyclase/phosphodiesterase n=1 Tax=Vallicoccus soli TaxID=2339232 RepID=A0A3A3Z1I6_9ACTN|nr:bifunctional diguanylate cyclase/phosphodiesterase [Vallicoccus soli]RJK94257.1 bifunctional diguanylate cyclase/phosphodiesterase [Vallicoccus soli]